MSATYTFDVFSTIDGFGSHTGDWGGYWGKQGPELKAHRAALYTAPSRTVLGAATYELFESMRGHIEANPDVDDPWVNLMFAHPTTAVATRPMAASDRPGVDVEVGDPAEIVRRLKEKSDVPLRSHGSLKLNRALLAAGLVDFIELTVFPVVCGQTGDDPVFAGAPDLDLELVEARTVDGRTQLLTYRPSLHG